MHIMLANCNLTSCLQIVTQERYRLDGEGDYEKEKQAKQVFKKAAAKVVRDSFSNARIQAIMNYHKRAKGVNVKKTPDLKKMHLEADEYAQGEIDWIMKDPDAWRWMCEHWAGEDFQGTSNRNRGNRTSKPGMQRFGADGFVGKEQRMVCTHVSTLKFVISQMPLTYALCRRLNWA